jgi:hypothetical protein
MHAMPHIDLVFDGLDTYTTIELDGKKILEYVLDKSPARTHLSPFRTNNMFVPYRIPLKPRLSSSDGITDHSLHITFHSTFLKGRSLQRKNAGKTPVARPGARAASGAGRLLLSYLSISDRPFMAFYRSSARRI